MAKTLDFTTRKKEFFTVKLDDEKQTVLLIGTPTKNVMQDFLALNMEELEDAQAINEIYEVCAKVMSFNKGGIKITSDYLSNECNFDIADIMTFFNAYSDFISEISHAKN